MFTIGERHSGRFVQQWRSGAITHIPYGGFGVMVATSSTALDYVGGGVTASTPEPSTWAMMVLGFAGLGFAGYRKARKTVAIAA